MRGVSAVARVASFTGYNITTGKKIVTEMRKKKKWRREIAGVEQMEDGEKQ